MTDKCWGVYAVQSYKVEANEYSSESDEPVFGTFSAKVYTAEVEEYELNCSDADPQGDDSEGLLLGGYGSKNSHLAYKRMMGSRTVSLFEYSRGNSATGVKGIIDINDPLNPYGPGNEDI